MSKESKKRTNDEMLTDETDEDFDKMFDIRKMQKCSPDEILGFCDGCEKLRPVTTDKDFPEFAYCIDCQIDNLSFETDMLEITKPTELNRTTSPKHPITE